MKKPRCRLIRLFVTILLLQACDSSTHSATDTGLDQELTGDTTATDIEVRGLDVRDDQDLEPELTGLDAQALDLDASTPDDIGTDSDAKDWEETADADASATQQTVPETLDASPTCLSESCVLLSNDLFDGESFQQSTSATFQQEFEGLTYFFRPYSRFRASHPGRVGRIWLYTQGEGAVRLQLSTGFPGGHHPCLDETTGDDQFPVGPVLRMEVSPEAGWRVFDLTSLEHEVGGFDEFFVLMDQEGDARVALAPAIPPQPGDYASNSGIIADAPGDGLECFSSMSVFGDDVSGNLAFVVRAELLTTQQLQERYFVRLTDGPALGGHASAGDFDNDGDDDILTYGTLYRNDGTAYVNVTEEAGLGALGGETLWGDFDNDGWRDVVGIGSSTFLFRNLGDGTFEDVSEGSGLFTGTSNQGAAWLDVEGDGFLDLMIASYGTLEDPEVAARDFLFLNQGDGTFLNATEAMGMSTGKICHGRGVCVADYDEDGDPDIYVGNYRLDPNFLWQNQGGEAGFKNVSYASGTQGVYEQGAYGHTIGPSFGDLNEDGWFDLVVPNLAHPRFIDFSDPTTILMNRTDGTFQTMETTQAGIAYDETHSDSTLLDVDNDGDLDLFLTAVYEGRRSYLYVNDGSAFFADDTYRAGILHMNGWGAAASDLDGDGDMDLMAHGIWVNQSQPGAWLQLRLVGGAAPGDSIGWSNRDAVGAVVRVESGQRTLTRQVEGGKGVGCQNSTRLHFGLAGADDPVTVHVRWPSGLTSDLSQLTPGTVVTVFERD